MAERRRRWKNNAAALLISSALVVLAALTIKWATDTNVRPVLPSPPPKISAITNSVSQVGAQVQQAIAKHFPAVAVLTQDVHEAGITLSVNGHAERNIDIATTARSLEQSAAISYLGHLSQSNQTVSVSTGNIAKTMAYVRQGQAQYLKEATAIRAFNAVLATEAARNGLEIPRSVVLSLARKSYQNYLNTKMAGLIPPGKTAKQVFFSNSALVETQMVMSAQAQENAVAGAKMVNGRIVNRTPALAKWFITTAGNDGVQVTGIQGGVSALASALPSGL